MSSERLATFQSLALMQNRHCKLNRCRACQQWPGREPFGSNVSDRRRSAVSTATQEAELEAIELGQEAGMDPLRAACSKPGGHGPGRDFGSLRWRALSR